MQTQQLPSAADFPPTLKSLPLDTLRAMAKALEGKQGLVPVDISRIVGEENRLRFMYDLGRRSIVEEVLAVVRLKERGEHGASS